GEWGADPVTGNGQFPPSVLRRPRSTRGSSGDWARPEPGHQGPQQFRPRGGRSDRDWRQPDSGTVPPLAGCREGEPSGAGVPARAGGELACTASLSIRSKGASDGPWRWSMSLLDSPGWAGRFSLWTLIWRRLDLKPLTDYGRPKRIRAWSNT